MCKKFFEAAKATDSYFTAFCAKNGIDVALPQTDVAFSVLMLSINRAE